jgi:hypothetical protein
VGSTPVLVLPDSLLDEELPESSVEVDSVALDDPVETDPSSSLELDALEEDDEASVAVSELVAGSVVLDDELPLLPVEDSVSVSPTGTALVPHPKPSTHGISDRIHIVGSRC